MRVVRLFGERTIVNRHAPMDYRWLRSRRLFSQLPRNGWIMARKQREPKMRTKVETHIVPAKSMLS